MVDHSEPRKLTRVEAAGMTVNERLWVAGMMDEFDEAVTTRDPEGMRRILKEVYLDKTAIETIVGRSLDKD